MPQLGVLEDEAGLGQPVWDHPLAVKDHRNDLPERDLQGEARQRGPKWPAKHLSEGFSEIPVGARVGRRQVVGTAGLLVFDQEQNSGCGVRRMDPGVVLPPVPERPAGKQPERQEQPPQGAVSVRKSSPFCGSSSVTTSSPRTP